jgi:cytochrome c2
VTAGGRLHRAGRRAVLWGVAALALVACASQHDEAGAERATGGDAGKGAEAIKAYGCGACHRIGGIRQATGTVGPPLTGLAARGFIAGELGNTPSNLVRWIMDPQEVEPGVAMPDLDVTEADARDIAAYLLSH